MARFGPTVGRRGVLETLGEIGHEFLDARDRRKARKREESDQGLADALTELELLDLGVRRGTAPREAPAFDAFEGAEIGLAGEPGPEVPSAFRGARPGLAAGTGGDLGEALGQLPFPRESARQGPQVVHLPGAFIRDVGFTERAITDADLVELTKARHARPRSVQARGTTQLTDDFFLDERPQLAEQERARGAASARSLAMLEAFSDLGATPEELNLLEADPEFADEVFDLVQKRSAPEEPGTIRQEGRDFPDTDDGRAAALAWREAVREVGGSGAGERITGETTRRALALAAARALAGIRDDVRNMSSIDRQRLEPGQIFDQIQNALKLFGFESVEELEAEQRELRTRGVGTTEPLEEEEGTGDGGGAGITDEQIDAILRDNPDMTDEEVIRLLTGR